MRYYCDNCKSEFKPGFETRITGSGSAHKGDEDWSFSRDCPYCGDTLFESPEWETPEQFEERTGRKWKGAVWWRSEDPEFTGFTWGIIRLVPNKTVHHAILLCADKDIQPPDDWRTR